MKSKQHTHLPLSGQLSSRPHRAMVDAAHSRFLILSLFFFLSTPSSVVYLFIHALIFFSIPSHSLLIPFSLTSHSHRSAQPINQTKPNQSASSSLSLFLRVIATTTTKKIIFSTRASCEIRFVLLFFFSFLWLAGMSVLLFLGEVKSSQVSQPVSRQSTSPPSSLTPPLKKN
jgi:hypothetical protein